MQKGYIDDVEKVQRRATKFPQNISHLSYPDRQAAINLPTLVYPKLPLLTVSWRHSTEEDHRKFMQIHLS